MRFPTLLLLCLASLLAACSLGRQLQRAPYLDPLLATARPAGVQPPAGGPLAAPMARRGRFAPVPAARVAAKRGFWRRPAAPAAYWPASDSAQPASAAYPRKCKGCTFNIVAGDQQITGKKATTAAAGATALGSTHGQTVTGDGNAASMPAAAAGGLLGKIKKTLGDVAGYLLLLGLLLLVLLILFRKRFGIPF